jgi:DNA-binding XRE family transcriptional regulator
MRGSLRGRERAQYGDNQHEANVTDNDIGRRIASARRELGLTKRELAERIGVMLGVLDAYENGMADPSPHLDRISSATGKEALWFLRGDPPEQIAARLQRHAAALAKREEMLGRREEELVRAASLNEARLRELSEVERRHEEASADLKLSEQALQAREDKLELGWRKLREASEEVADRAAALAARESELEASRQRDAEKSNLLSKQLATFGSREEALTEREQDLERRQVELASWMQAAERVRTELRNAQATVEAWRHRASAERAAAVSERAELELRALDLERLETKQAERSAQLEAKNLKQAEAAEREVRLPERERVLAAREGIIDAREKELKQRLTETRERAREHDELERKQAEAFAELSRIEAELREREHTITRVQTELLTQAAVLDERRRTLEQEQRRLEQGRAEAERRLVGLLQDLRTAAALLEAQLAEEEVEVGRPSVEAGAMTGELSEADETRRKRPLRRGLAR